MGWDPAITRNITAYGTLEELIRYSILILFTIFMTVETLDFEHFTNVHFPPVFTLSYNIKMFSE